MGVARTAHGPRVLYHSALISILFLITAYSAAGAQCNQPIQRDSKQDTSHVVKTSDLITQTYCLKFLQTCDCLRGDGDCVFLCFCLTVKLLECRVWANQSSPKFSGTGATQQHTPYTREKRSKTKCLKEVALDLPAVNLGVNRVAAVNLL